MPVDLKRVRLTHTHNKEVSCSCGGCLLNEICAAASKFIKFEREPETKVLIDLVGSELS
jgi:hypothetical protein